MSNEQSNGNGGAGSGVDRIVLIQDLCDWGIVVERIARLEARLRRSVAGPGPDTGSDFEVLFDDTLDLVTAANETWEESLLPRLKKLRGPRRRPPWPL